MSDQDSTTNTNRSGGADLNAQGDITVGGDVVGRDKITHTEQIDTDGGAAVKGDVIVDGGSTFVGRDQNIFTGDQQYDVHSLANPYLGLQSFTYADHAKYAGREKPNVETVARLTAPDDPLALLFITGASGSGKSSFVQAGVLSALEKHYAVLNLKWAVFRPSRDPLAALADAIWRQLGLPQFDTHTISPADFGDFLQAHTPAQQVNVIVIDQFEELFTQSNSQPRDALFTLLTQLPSFRSTHTHIIATVRADYLPELFALPALYDIAKRGIDLRAMSVAELREAIQQPLRAAYPNNTKRFQTELVERLAQDAAEDAAYLPLLQVTLEEIWRKGTLTVGSYTNLADAIKQRADKVLAYQDYDAAQPTQPRTPEEQAAILNLCLDLVDVSLDDQARRDVRRRRSKDELVSDALDRARLIDTLTQARLLSVGTESGEPTHVEVDLIHETLLSNWDRLRQAIAERRHELRQRVRFEQQLNEWIGQNRSDAYLLSGVHLAAARELENRGDVALRGVDAKDFVRFSLEREDARRLVDLDNKRRLTELQAFRNRMEQLSKALVGSSDMPTLVMQIVNVIADEFGVKASSLYLIDDYTGKLVIQAATGYQEPLVQTRASYEIGEGITGWVAQHGSAVRANSLEELHQLPAWREKHAPWHSEHTPTSFLALPLTVTDRYSGQERVIGVLEVEDISPSDTHPEVGFTDQDQVLMNIMASVIAAVIYNTQGVATQFQNFRQELATLTRVLTGGHDTRILVSDVVNTLANALRVDASSLYLVDEMTGKLVIQAATGYQTDLVKMKATYDLGEGVTGWIALRAEPFRSNSIAELRSHPAWKGKQNRNQADREPHSFLGLPLIVMEPATGQERVIGVLKLEGIWPTSDHPEPYFTDQDVILVEMMANIIALSINSATAKTQR